MLLTWSGKKSGKVMCLFFLLYLTTIYCFSFFWCEKLRKFWIYRMSSKRATYSFLTFFLLCFNFLLLLFFICVSEMTCTSPCICVHALMETSHTLHWSLRNNVARSNEFSPVIWVPGTEIWSSCMAVSVLALWPRRPKEANSTGYVGIPRWFRQYVNFCLMLRFLSWATQVLYVTAWRYHVFYRSKLSTFLEAN